MNKAFERVMIMSKSRRFLGVCLGLCVGYALPWNGERDLGSYGFHTAMARQLSDDEKLFKQFPKAGTLFNQGCQFFDHQQWQKALPPFDEFVHQFSGVQDPVMQKLVAQALSNKGFILSKLERYDEAIVIDDDVVHRFSSSQNNLIQEAVAQALVNKGFSLNRLDRPEEAIAVYNNAIHQFGVSQDPVIQGQISEAFLNKGDALKKLSRYEEAIAAYDEVVNRFGALQNLAVQRNVGMALLNKGVSLVNLHRYEEALAANNEVLRRFSGSQDKALLRMVATALVNKSINLGYLHRDDEAAAVNNEAIRLLKDIQSNKDFYTMHKDFYSRSGKELAQALLNKGIMMDKFHRNTEAFEAWDELIRLFRGDPTVRGDVALAFFFEGNIFYRTHRLEQAVAFYNEAVRMFDDIPHTLSLDQKEDVVEALFFGAQALQASNRPIEAALVYKQLVLRFGNQQGGTIRQYITKARAELAKLQY